jgi:hypothetical protein
MSSGFAVDIAGARSAAARPTVIVELLFIFLSSFVVDVFIDVVTAGHPRLRLRAHQLQFWS